MQLYMWLGWREGGVVPGKLLSLSPLQSVIRNTLLPSLDIRFSLAVTQRTSTPESNSSIMQIINTVHLNTYGKRQNGYVLQTKSETLSRLVGLKCKTIVLFCTNL